MPAFRKPIDGPGPADYPKKPMRPRIREGRARKSLIFGGLCLAVSLAAAGQTPSTLGPSDAWIESPYRNFGPPHTLLAGRAVLLDEEDDPALKALLSIEIPRLFNDLYVRQGWRSPFAEGEPLRIFVARKVADGFRGVAARSVEGGRLVDAAVLLDSRGMTDHEIVREVGRQIALATLAGYRVADGTFATEAAAALISGTADEEDREAARLIAAAPELSIETSPRVLGRLYLEELTRDGPPLEVIAAYDGLEIDL